MSVRLMAAVFELEIPAREKLVLLAMADHARDDGTGCYPSIGLLARKTSQTRRGVQKIMRRLEEQYSLLKPTQLRVGTSTEYRITLKDREQGPLFTSKTCEHRTHPPCEPDSHPLRTPDASPANGVRTPCEPGSPEPSVTTKEPPMNQVVRRKSDENSSFPEDFLRFWEAYPKREARARALSRWKHMTVTDRAAALEGVKRWKSSGRWDDRQYIPLAVTYLNGRRWEDEITCFGGNHEGLNREQFSRDFRAAAERVGVDLRKAN